MSQRAFVIIFLVWMMATLALSQNPCSAGKMWTNYNAMKAANCRNCDKYFHCQGNYEAVRNCRGILQVATATAISNLREWAQGNDTPDSAADQAANVYGRNGGNCAGRYLGAVNCKWNPRTKKCG
ncbi:serum amyloid A-5 protein [Folsomia candida]|uniref:Serum amyloid A protein n=1 Tax=Folsomia candida TaxID=158441 RepID=A0A226F2N0_FOLCA|nr:serum amyloid A-5 protein [Folsomia candida]OXA63196.1 Serum amyloid A protein [Folsomia candida]